MAYSNPIPAPVSLLGHIMGRDDSFHFRMLHFYNNITKAGMNAPPVSPQL